MTKRMGKRAAAFLLALATMLALTGCWNNRPITDLSIVVGLGFDRASNGDIELTAQIVVPSRLNQATSGSGGQGSDASVALTVEGETSFDAARNLLKKINRKAYFGHVQLLVFGENMARSGINDPWDFLERDNEFSRTMRVVVVQGGTAASLLKAKPLLGNLGAIEIEETLDSSENFGKSASVKSFEVTQLLGNPNAAIVTGVIKDKDAADLTNVEVEGGAVFRHAKLVGYLTPDETRGYLFASNKIQSTILVVKNPAQKDKKLSLEVIRSQGNTSADIHNGKPRLHIDVNASGNLGEEQGTEDLYESRYITKIESEAADLIAEDIRTAAAASRKMDGDIFSMSDLLHRTSYEAFSKLEDRWDAAYQTADFDVKVRFHLVESGLINRPAYRQ